MLRRPHFSALPEGVLRLAALAGALLLLVPVVAGLALWLALDGAGQAALLGLLGPVMPWLLPGLLVLVVAAVLAVLWVARPLHRRWVVASAQLLDVSRTVLATDARHRPA